MPSTKLVEKRKEFEAKQNKLIKAFEEAGDEMDLMKSTELTGEDSKARTEEVQRMNKELEDLGKEIDELVELEDAEREAKNRQRVIKGWSDDVPPPESNRENRPKTFGELFTESDAYKMRKEREIESEIKFSMKTLFQTSAGWAPESIRTGKVVEYATRPIQIIDLVPPGSTDMVSIVYMEETTFTNNAAEVAEGNQFAEAALALTERSSSVRKIAVFIPVTDEQLDDVSGIQSYLDNRLRFMLRQRLDYQIVNGDGIAPNLTGILNVTGIQSFARSQEHFDALAEAMRRVRVTGRAIPNVFVIHSTNWWSQNMRLRKTNTGEYVWGHPSQPGPDRIWGLPMVETEVLPVNTSLVGDFPNHCQLFEKQGIDVKISDSHSDYFIKGKQAIRATVRVALPVYRPAAFCAITNMA